MSNFVARAEAGAFRLKAYRGDAKTLLAFDLTTEASREHLAGFTVQVVPPGKPAYYLQNSLRFEHPANHAQDPSEPAFSSLNAPLHKFRWVHVPGSVHQGLNPTVGEYTYTVTPRYFDSKGAMQALNPDLSVSLKIEVNIFTKGSLTLGFTRGFTQSQAFVRHFGLKAKIRPLDASLMFDTTQLSGTNAKGESFTFAQQYQWLGFTARSEIFKILDQVQSDPALKLDMFAYDLNEPDLLKALLELVNLRRLRIILDNAALHHDSASPKPEDQFEAEVQAINPDGVIKRGHFLRYSHNKVLVVSRNGLPCSVLTGSTNFSVTGLYVNANHVIVFDNPDVAKKYQDVFDASWNQNVKAPAFKVDGLSQDSHLLSAANVGDMTITFSPHDEQKASEVLTGLVNRVKAESAVEGRRGNVFFAVMELSAGEGNPVYEALNALHADGSVFSYGISDSPEGIALYRPGQRTGVLVTGKPTNTRLPPPFSQVPSVGLGHQVHHKFVICGFNGDNPVVYCGSSNLALKGEQVNGDNLLEIRDPDIVAAFAIEALLLVDHFHFLDNMATGPKGKPHGLPSALPQQAAVASAWFLATSDGWVSKYFDPDDLHFTDRTLFAR